MTEFKRGDEVTFESRAGRKFPAVVVDPTVVKRKIAVLLPGDPFRIMVNIAQVSKGEDHMPGPESRQLSKKARMLAIPGYTKMGITELRAAVKAAENPRKREAATATKVVSKKTGAVKVVARKVPPRKARAAKKTVQKRTPAKVAKARSAKKVAKKASTKKAVSPNGANPYRVGSNVWKMAEELLRGGKRADMIKRLKKSMPLHPWSKDKEENPDRAIDKRLLMTAADLNKSYGYKIVREGRGAAGTIIVHPPGRKAVAKAGAKKASSRTTTSGRR